MMFKDHFSDGSEDYARYRPGYPTELFDWLAARAPGRDLVWDCATGSGQAALPLAEHFKSVVATDASEQQISNARRCPGVQYRVCPAEASGLPERSVDLVTVAQALHWFDHDAFYREVRRVARPRALCVAWTYTAARMEGPVGELVRRYHTDIVGPWWPAERDLVDAGYADIPFPFERVEAPSLRVTLHCRRDDLLGYLGTWSATRRCRRTTGRDPLAWVAPRLAGVWPDGDESLTLQMPLTVLAGVVHR